jgi:hypothetical protein
MRLFPRLALVIYVGTVLAGEAWAAQPGPGGGGRAGEAWKTTWCSRPSSARFYGAPFHRYPQNTLQPLPQEAERFIAVK